MNPDLLARSAKMLKAAQFFLILGGLLLIIRFNISSQIRRLSSDHSDRDYAVGARKSLPILTFAISLCFGVGLLALLVHLLNF